MKPLVYTFFTLTLAGSTFASTITLVNNLGTLQGLGTTSTVSWGTAASETGNPIVSPYAVASSPSNITTTASIATGTQDFIIAVEGSLWSGNFSNGDVLLWTDGNSSPMMLAFSTAIQGLGFRIQSATSGAFVATLTAFGTGNVNFGSVTVNGTSSISNGTGTNTAPFLGFSASAKDIVAVQISISGVNPNDFAIGAATLLDAASGSSGVPEPATILLSGLGLAGLMAWRRRVA